MKTRHSFIPFVLFSMWLCGGATLRAQDPIIQTKYTADPAPMVYNDTVFLYTGHDEDDAYSFKMFDWQLYTSTDMVNWTDHGTVATTKTFLGGKSKMGLGPCRWWSGTANSTCIVLFRVMA